MDYLSHFGLTLAPFATTPDPRFAYSTREHRQALSKIAYYTEERRGIFLLTGAIGTGKCLGVDTPVLRHDGRIVPVQDVRPGDLLMGPDSQPRLVLSTTRGRDPLYRIVPAKGTPYVVNGAHILSLKATSGSHGELRDKGGEIFNLSVEAFLRKSATFQRDAKGWRTGVDFPAPAALRLDPYFLGIWLGDGDSHGPRITTTDVPVVDYLEEFAERSGVTLQRVCVKGDRCPMYDLTTGRSCGAAGLHLNRNPIRSALRSYGLLGHKHIPHDFKTASECERLRLLAGLIDSDGSLSDNGYDFVFKQADLAEDLAFLARSLGLAAYVQPCIKKCHNNGVSGAYHRVSVSGDTQRIPVRLPRKQAAVRRQKKEVLVTRIHIEEIGEGDYYGFEITGDGLFLLGDFTVTHNTTISQLALNGWRAQPDKFLAAHVTDPSPRTEAAFLRLCLASFGQQTTRNVLDLKAILRGFLVDQYKAGRTVVLMLDEAQTIHANNLDTIQALSNEQTQTAKLIQIVLLAQPNFEHKLTHKPALRSRIAGGTTLNPLTLEDAIDLLRHRMEVAGGDFDHVFPVGTHKALYNATNGVPRDLCILCDAAMVNALTDGVRVVDDRVLAGALKDLEFKKWGRK